MVMAQGSIHGRLVWQELTSEDPAAAAIFYSKLVGWHARPNATHPAYTEFGIGGSQYAGMTPLTDDARAAGVRSHWLPYIGASDVDSAVATAQQLGATVVHAAQDIEHVGRFATLKDPQGAQFAVFKPSGSGGGAGTAGKPPVGSFAWLELATSDYEAASTFYGKVFGWQVMARMDMGPAGMYLIFGADGVQLGGMYKMHAERTSTGYWLPYAEVSNADTAATVATAAGGRIVVGPMDVPGGRMVQVVDPSGALFAVHATASAAAPAPSKPAAKPAAPKPAAPKPAAPKPVSAATPAASPAAPPPAAPAAKPAAAKKAAPRKAVAKKPAARKAVTKKPAAKKAAGKKAAAKKKGVAKKSAAKSAKKSVKKSAKKSPKKSAKKAARKSGPGKKKPTKRAGGKAKRKK